MSNPNDQAIAIMNRMLAVADTFATTLLQANQLVEQWNNLNLGAIVNQFKTTTVNADGSLGTADTTPVDSNVIDTRVYSTLAHATSANDFSVFQQFMEAYNQLMTGAVVTQQVQALGLFARLVPIPPTIS